METQQGSNRLQEIIQMADERGMPISELLESMVERLINLQDDEITDDATKYEEFYNSKAIGNTITKIFDGYGKNLDHILPDTINEVVETLIEKLPNKLTLDQYTTKITDHIKEMKGKTLTKEEEKRNNLVDSYREETKDIRLNFNGEIKITEQGGKRYLALDRDKIYMEEKQLGDISVGYDPISDTYVFYDTKKKEIIGKDLKEIRPEVYENNKGKICLLVLGNHIYKSEYNLPLTNYPIYIIKQIDNNKLYFYIKDNEIIPLTEAEKVPGFFYGKIPNSNPEEFISVYKGNILNFNDEFKSVVYDLNKVFNKNNNLYHLTDIQNSKEIKSVSKYGHLIIIERTDKTNDLAFLGEDDNIYYLRSIGYSYMLVKGETYKKKLLIIFKEGDTFDLLDCGDGSDLGEFLKDHTNFVGCEETDDNKTIYIIDSLIKVVKRKNKLVQLFGGSKKVERKF